MKKPAIPSAEPTKKNMQALIENVEIITGRRGQKIEKLSSNATLSDVIAKMNEVITVLQD